MKLFGQIVGTIIETVKLPVDVVKDIGDAACEEPRVGKNISNRLEKIKDEAKGGG